MSLYSNNLCGLVLLTDDRVSTYSGVAKEFSDICQRSTEYHFPPFELQARLSFGLVQIWKCISFFKFKVLEIILILGFLR